MAENIKEYLSTRDWVNFSTNTRLSEIKSQSALVRCLLQESADTELFTRLITLEGLTSIYSNKKHQVIVEKVNKIIEWRALLNIKFTGRPEDKKFCILCLGHLISAHYSGKAQSLAAVDWTLIRLVNAMANRKPIIFTFCFGGYKSHTSSSHPEVDWAELFNINYLVTYLYPLIKEYSYGVEIEYESEEVLIQFNNVPQEKIDKYTTSFKKLLAYYTGRVLQKYGLNLTLRLVIARGLYDEGVSKLYEFMEQKKPYYRTVFDELSEELKDKWIQRAAANYMWDGGVVSHDDLSEWERYEILKEARINNETFLDADYTLRCNWFEHEYRIPLIGTWGRMPSAQPIDSWLHIKSTAVSIVDAWIGTWFLEARTVNFTIQYRETILSKSQMLGVEENTLFMDHSDEELKRVSVNFNKIPLLIPQVKE